MSRETAEARAQLRSSTAEGSDSLLPMEHQRPQFDALPQRSIRGRRGIDEGGVRGKPGPAIGLRVIAFQ